MDNILILLNNNYLLPKTICKISFLMNFEKEEDNEDYICICIESICSGTILFNLKVNKFTKVKKLYDIILKENNKDNAIILFIDHTKNKLEISDKSLKEEGLKDGSILTLFNKELTEREILEKIYTSTNGQNWKYHQNWLSDKPLNEWIGIKTIIDNEDKLIVLCIKLYDIRLTGEIPRQIGNLVI